MAYRAEYTVVRPFDWKGRSYAIGEEFCEKNITMYQLHMLTEGGRLSLKFEIIYQRPGRKKGSTVAA